MSYTGRILQPVNNVIFSDLNWYGSGTTTSSALAGNSLAFVNTAPSSGDHLVGGYITAPSTPYCVIANFSYNQGSILSLGNGSNTKIFGLGFVNAGINGAIHMVGAMATDGNSGTYLPGIFEWNSLSNLAGTINYDRSQSGFPTGMQKWFQIRDDGTNIYFYYGTDAVATNATVHWVKFYQQARTSYITPANIAWVIDNNALGINSFTLKSWQVLAL